MIVVDPRETEMATSSSLHLPLKVGTDIALLNAMMNLIIQNDWYDKQWVGKHTEEFERLRQRVEPYTLAHAAAITGLQEEQIAEATRLYAQAKDAMIAYTLGITEHHCGVNNVFAIGDIALLTGHMGKEGNGIIPLRGQNNVQGAGDMGCLPNQLPGAIPLGNIEARLRFEEHWGRPIPPENGRTQTQMLERIESGEIHFLYIIGENPLMADVHMHHTEKTLEKLDFIVVQDLFLTETAAMADVVLPARSWGEVEGTYTNTERRVQRVRPLIDPLPGTKDDWQILCELAQRLGYSMEYQNSEEIWEEVRMLATHLYGGMSYERLDREGGLQYPCPTLDHPGTVFINEYLQQEEAQQKARFVPVEFTPPAELPDEEYPFMLTTGRRYELYNTNTQTAYYPPNLKRRQLEETCDMHPDDAEKLGIAEGDWVQVSSRRGKVSVKAKVTKQVQPGLIFMSFHFREVPTNRLTLDVFDPIAGTAEYKACAVKIEPLRSTVEVE